MNRQVTRLIILGALLLFGGLIEALPFKPIFEKFTRKEGLFHTYLKEVLQDSSGYLWLASTEGLMRYDGNTFDVFRANANDSNSISSNMITFLLEDRVKNDLYITYRSGEFSRLDLETYQIESHFKYVEKDNKKAILRIRKLAVLSDSVLVLGTFSQGIFLFNTRTKRFSDVSLTVEGKNNYSTNMVLGYGSKVYVGTPLGLVVVSRKGEVERVFKPEEKDPFIARVFPYSEEALLIVSRDQIFKYSIANNRATVFIDDMKGVTGMAFDRDGNFWVSSRINGLYYFNPQGELIRRFNVQMYENAGFISNNVSGIFYAHKPDILWITTEKGLMKLDYGKIKFKSYDLSMVSSMVDRSLFMLFKDSQETLYVWSHEGFFYKEKKSLFFLSHDFLNEHVSIEWQPQFAEDAYGRIWISGGEDVWVFTPETSRISKKSFLFEGVNIKNNRTLYLTDDVLYLAGSQGVIVYSISSDSYFFLKFPEELLVSDIFVNGVFVSDDNYIWLSTYQGLLVRMDLRGKTKIISEYSNQKGVVHTNSLNGFFQDSKGNGWVATSGSGLLLVNEEGQFVNAGFNDEVIGSAVYAIMEDNLGYIWISTNFGICRLNNYNHQIDCFDQREGTFCEEFNNSTFFKDANGRMYMGGIGGLVEFDPMTVFNNLTPPAVCLSSFEVGDNTGLSIGRKKAKKQYGALEELKIQEGFDYLRFNIGVLNFRHSHKNRIRWQLQGIDEGWNFGRPTDPIEFFHLENGEYVLRVQGANNDNYWGTDELRIPIAVSRPFYEHTWFLLLLITFLLGLLTLIYYIRVSFLRRQKKRLAKEVKLKTQELVTIARRLKSSKEKIELQNAELEMHRNYLEDQVQIRTRDLNVQKERAEKSDKLKTAFLANLSHEIRTPMNSIIGFSNFLGDESFSREERMTFVKTIQRNSESLLVLIDDMIEMSRIETGLLTIDLKEVSLKQLVTDLDLAVQFFPRKETVRFSMEINDIPDDFSFVSDLQRLKQILINLISNGLKFTDRGSVKVAVRLCSGDQHTSNFVSVAHGKPPFRIICFEVIDTGIGLSQQDATAVFEPFRKVEPSGELRGGMGLGLSIVKRIVELLNGEIWVRSEPGKGSTFGFYLPIEE